MPEPTPKDQSQMGKQSSTNKEVPPQKKGPASPAGKGK